MAFWRNKAPDLAVLALVGIAITLWTLYAYSLLSVALVVTSLVLCGVSMGSCIALLGPRSARIFLVVSAALGWFAEQMGATKGWLFGNYAYTDVLGPKLGAVPVVIPLMWFGLCYIGFVMASLVLWRQPAPPATGWKTAALAALMAALIVTAFDLGADPYFVYILKAWIMGEKDGDWFGETVRGFEGWMIVSFAIACVFQALAKPGLAAPPAPSARLAAVLPVGMYFFMMAFQMAFTQPTALRVIAFFAMGIPTLIAFVAWQQWSTQLREAAA